MFSLQMFDQIYFLDKTYPFFFFQPPTGPSSVPIFALHPKGAYYIPLSVDYNLIAPYLVVLAGQQQQQDEAGGGSGQQQGSPAVMLHPVTINVNFCGPLQVNILYVQLYERTVPRIGRLKNGRYRIEVAG